MTSPANVRSMVVILGDQLSLTASAFDGFDAHCDMVWMAEVQAEATYVWSSKQRIAVFLAAMRHFAMALQDAGIAVNYCKLEDPANLGSLAQQLRFAIASHQPQRLVMTAPGEWRLLQDIKRVAGEAGIALDVRPDRHFFATVQEFDAHAKQRRTLRLEYFYREMRRRHRVLMDGDEPAGGSWNYDAANRERFVATDIADIPERALFAPDALTREVLDMVAVRFADHPGNLTTFDWPLTRSDALIALERFVEQRLAQFGRFQDAMWRGQAWAYHSHLSSALNLKLLDAREVVQAAEAAYRRGAVPLASAEGFIRQILGWREYVRGVYWTQMPSYLLRNELAAAERLPAFFWTGQTAMVCMRDTIEQTLEFGYAHHIQRLMVTGLYALLLGVEPRSVHEWYLAVYVDAVEWVELPNTMGMSQYADGGIMGSKPYIASGKYIDRMSNYCASCRYDPAQRTSDDACPFTTLYWDFLLRHSARLGQIPRLAFQVKNLSRLSGEQRAAVARRAAAIRGDQIGDSSLATSAAGIGRLNK